MADAAGDLLEHRQRAAAGAWRADSRQIAQLVANDRLVRAEERGDDHGSGFARTAGVAVLVEDFDEDHRGMDMVMLPGGTGVGDAVRFLAGIARREARPEYTAASLAARRHGG